MRIPTQRGQLEPLAASHAHEMFELIHQSRSHLHQWLPWLQRIHSHEDTLAFILDLLAERGPQWAVKVDERVRRNRLSPSWQKDGGYRLLAG